MCQYVMRYRITTVSDHAETTRLSDLITVLHPESMERRERHRPQATDILRGFRLPRDSRFSESGY
jgi:hypothetical protein